MPAIKNKVRTIAVLVSFGVLVLTGLPTGASGNESEADRLQSGQVVVSLRKQEDIDYVTGKILINEPPGKVWPIMTNPFEFEGKISPRMTEVKVMVDKVDLSLLQCRVHIGFFIPDITYVVESKYEPVEHIHFKRVSGNLKDFRGEWEVKPACGGHKTELTYSMYIEPGFPVPQWIVREGVKSELPRILNALRERVAAIYNQNEIPESRTILAAGTVARTGLLPASPALPSN